MVIIFFTVPVTVFANNYSLIGDWKTIDDRTGYALSKVHIRQVKDGTYEGVIVDAYSLPGAAIKTKCTHCVGRFKDKPFIGSVFFWGFKQSRENPNEFLNGEIVDPADGKLYKGRIKLHPNGKKITVRGYLGDSPLGRSAVWIRQ